MERNSKLDIQPHQIYTDDQGHSITILRRDKFIITYKWLTDLVGEEPNIKDLDQVIKLFTRWNFRLDPVATLKEIKKANGKSTI